MIKTINRLLADVMAERSLDWRTCHADIVLRPPDGRTVVCQCSDEAVLGDLAELRIIHGKGTGALRERVGEILSADSRIRSFRLGRHGEGGAGVTIGVLR